LLVGPTKIKDWTAGFEKHHFAASRGGKGTSTVEHDHAPLFSEQWSHAPLRTVH